MVGEINALLTLGKVELRFIKHFPDRLIASLLTPPVIDNLIP